MYQRTCFSSWNWEFKGTILSNTQPFSRTFGCSSAVGGWLAFHFKDSSRGVELTAFFGTSFGPNTFWKSSDRSIEACYSIFFCIYPTFSWKPLQSQLLGWEFQVQNEAFLFFRLLKAHCIWSACKSNEEVVNRSVCHSGGVQGEWEEESSVLLTVFWAVQVLQEYFVTFEVYGCTCLRWIRRLWWVREWCWGVVRNPKTISCTTFRNFPTQCQYFCQIYPPISKYPSSHCTACSWRSAIWSRSSLLWPTSTPFVSFSLWFWRYR